MCIRDSPTGQQQLSRNLVEELQGEARSYARTVIKPKVNLVLARQAIGVTPTDGKAPAAPAGQQ